MITKIIASYPGQPKQVQILKGNSVMYIRGFKRAGERPHLIQVFVDSQVTEKDKNEILCGIRRSVHQVHGRVTVNGQFISQWFESIRRK